MLTLGGLHQHHKIYPSMPSFTCLEGDFPQLSIGEKEATPWSAVHNAVTSLKSQVENISFSLHFSSLTVLLNTSNKLLIYILVQV